MEAVEMAKEMLGAKVKEKAPAVAKPKEVSTEVTYGVGKDIEAWEITPPRALLMQAKHPWVEANPRGVFQGEIRSGLDQELLGSDTKPFEVVIFGHTKEWRITEPQDGGTKALFIRSEPITAETADAPKEWDEGYKKLRRTRVDRYLAIDVNAVASLPYEIVMSGMSFMTAKNLNTKFFALATQGKSSLDVVVGLTTELREFDGNKNQAFKFTIARESTEKEKAVAISYARALAKGQIKAAAEEEILF